MRNSRRVETLSNLPVNLLAGGSDGLLVAFLLSAALKEWGLNSTQILWVGLGYGLWASLAMTWAGYLASRGETHHYEETPNPIIEELDLETDLMESMRREEEEDRRQWRKYQQELGLPLVRPSKSLAWKQGLQIGMAYLFSLFLLLSPYLFLPVSQAYSWSLAVGLILMAGLGLWRGRYTRRSPLLEMGRMLGLATAGLILLRVLAWTLG